MSPIAGGRQRAALAGTRPRGFRPDPAATASSSPPEVCASASSSCSASGEPAEVDVGRDERVVALRAARDHARGEQLAHAVDHRHRAGVDDRADARRGAHLAQVAEQAEARDVGRGVHADLDRGVARAGVERRHHLDRGRERAPAVATSRFTAVEITPSPIGFVSTSASPGWAPRS